MTDLPNLSIAILRDHFRDQMTVRGLTEEQVRAVLAAPEQVLDVRPGRVVAQRMIRMSDAAAGKEYLVRVFVDVDRVPPELVTVYRTSKVAKYRSRP